MIKKYYFQTLAAALAIGLVCSLLYGLGFFISWQMKLADALFISSKPDERIVIVAIDNESLEKIGRWPWDRSIVADLVNEISQVEPAVIGLDVNFPEASSASEDSRLASALARAKNVILPVEAELVFKGNEVLANQVLLPIESIREKAAGLGLTNTPPDVDGIFRRVPLGAFNKAVGKEYASFSLVLARFYAQKTGLVLAEPVADKKNRLIINYLGQSGTFKTISAAEILGNNINVAELKNKIVLIGATAPDLHDEQLVPTSSSKPMSGVEIHANAVATLLSGDFLTSLGKIHQMAILFCLAIFVVLVITRFKVLFGSLISFSVLLIYLTAALILFDYGLILDLFYPFLVFILSYAFGLGFKYLMEKREKQQIKNAFSHYMSPSVVSELLEHPEKLKLGGEKREITIMFSDIRGFTTISEKLSPEKLVALLNDYLTAMTDLILEKRGVLDKYIGDAIMAFWGAPLLERRHGRLALQTAVAMIQVLKEKQPQWRKKFKVELNIGIGLNRGEAIVGNMGSDQRFDYTAMGDTVNLASRLEGLTKQYGVRIIASQSARGAAGPEFAFRYLDKVAVKGKELGVDIYELKGLTNELKDEEKELIQKFERGIELYQDRKWSEAADFFVDLGHQYPDDGPTKVYSERCLEFENNPPEKDWDGIHCLKTK